MNAQIQIENTHTIAVLVTNEPGVLARVIGLFSGRGYNIESLTVAETDADNMLSRITVVTRGAPHVIEQLKSQLDRIVPVHRVVDLSRLGGANGDNDPIERELAILKVAGQGDKRLVLVLKLVLKRVPKLVPMIQHQSNQKLH